MQRVRRAVPLTYSLYDKQGESGLGTVSLDFLGAGAGAGAGSAAREMVAMERKRKRKRGKARERPEERIRKIILGCVFVFVLV